MGLAERVRLPVIRENDLSAESKALALPEGARLPIREPRFWLESPLE